MDIVPSTHPALWSVAEPVVDFSEASLHAGMMIRVMQAKNGVGLAAPQIGVSQRIFIMKDGENIITVINPVLLSHGKDEETEIEGCLSFPGQRVPVKRWRVITVEYHDGVKMVTRTLKGMVARIWQHEYCHLEGKCILPRPENPA